MGPVGPLTCEFNPGFARTLVDHARTGFCPLAGQAASIAKSAQSPRGNFFCISLSFHYKVRAAAILRHPVLTERSVTVLRR